jgi:hypothetical protein
MKIAKQPDGAKLPVRFTALQGSSTSYIYKTANYEIRADYACSNFYAPDFFRVTVSDNNGKMIWSGGERTFIDTLFVTEIISESYNRLVLCSVGDVADPGTMEVIAVDLTNGSEQVLAGPGSHHSFGHLLSSDAAYYSTGSKTYCVNLETGNSIDLSAILNNHFKGIKTWWPCPVKDCILVITTAAENNISLFNIVGQVVTEQLTLGFDTADSYNLSIVNVAAEQAVYIAVNYSVRNAQGILGFSHTSHYLLGF